MQLYDLTPITGARAGERRVTVVFGRVWQRRTVYTSILGGIVGMLVGSGLFLFVGMSGFAVGAFIGVGVMVLATAYSTRGLKIRLWRDLYHRTRANNGKPAYVRKRVDLDDSPPRTVVPSLTAEFLASLPPTFFARSET